MNLGHNPFIYVPQGRTVRLSEETSQLGIKGAYSDNFNFCHLVIIIGNNRISFTHADFRTEQKQIDEEIAWVGKNCKKYLFYRKKSELYLKQVQANGDIEELRHTFIVNTRLREGSLKTPSPNWQHQLVTETVARDIAVKFDAKTNSGIPHIQYYPMESQKENLLRHPKENLLRHPQEEKFVIAHKIEESQICFLSKSKLVKQNVIFDSQHWVLLPNAEMHPFHTDQRLLAGYLSELKKESSSGVLKFTESLYSLLKTKVYGDATIISDSFEEYVSYFARYFQDYLVVGDPDELAIRDFQEILKKYKQKQLPLSQADNLLHAKLSEEKSMSQIAELIRSLPKTSFTSYVEEKFFSVQMVYQERSTYRNLQNSNALNGESIKKDIQSLEHRASSKDCDYGKLAVDYSLLAKKAWLYFIESESVLREIYRQAGHCYSQVKQYPLALPYLQKAEKLARLTKDIDYLKNFKAPLDECNAFIKKEHSVLTESKNGDKGRELREVAAGIKNSADFKGLAKEALGLNVFWDQSTNKNTALHWALEKGQYEKAIILLEEEKAFLMEHPKCEKRLLLIRGKPILPTAKDGLLAAELVTGKELPPKLTELLGINIPSVTLSSTPYSTKFI